MDNIEKIIFTLGLIEVRGVQNLSRLLGCIQQLQSMLEKQKGEAENG